MPHIDARTGEIVIRIVYDGAPEAGKTTNVHQLATLISLQRRGAAKSPGATGDRTEFFDWLDFTGGYLDGRRVRCQLVSVPGQSRLLHRRRYLLDSADAIVFVTDSRPDAFVAAAQNLATTVRIAERSDEGVRVGLILQANKQDLPDAVAPAEVASALGVRATTPVVGSVAAEGEGVMQTFILAVRLATDRVRALLSAAAPAIRSSHDDPEKLHEELLEVERAEAARVEAERLEAERAEAVRAAAERAEAARREAERIEAERREAERIEAERSEAESVEAERRESERVEAEHGAAEKRLGATTELRRNGATEDRDRDIVLPRAHEIASGHVWPPVKGRAAFASATARPLRVPQSLRPWAPAEGIELESDDGWVLHSSEQWVFDDETSARLRLLTLVRHLLPLGDWVAEGRSLAIAKDGGLWRLWLLTPQVPSIDEHAAALLRRNGAPALAAFLGGAVATLATWRALGPLERLLPAGTSGMGVQDGRLVLLSLDDGSPSPESVRREPVSELSMLAARLAVGHGELQRWLEGDGAALLRFANSTERA
jgi:signal recognition particle receptor subunit beta